MWLTGHNWYGYVQHSLANGPCYILSALEVGGVKHGSTFLLHQPVGAQNVMSELIEPNLGFSFLSVLQNK